MTPFGGVPLQFGWEKSGAR
uniref:Uncharacterized protein n=1 Tax=Arundo donax TaxID=35708 RepID=A0A0A8YK79_ARUDO